MENDQARRHPRRPRPLDAAQKSITSARKSILATMTDGESAKRELAYLDASNLTAYKSGDEKIVEGVFTGESMLGSDGNTYPVPRNYASKSHLVQGSKLKAIIGGDGKTYKIIEEMPYETKIGLIASNRDKFQVVSDGKAYNLLMASVTYLKAEIGDTVSLRVPKGKEATYATLEALIPKEEAKIRIMARRTLSGENPAIAGFSFFQSGSVLDSKRVSDIFRRSEP